MWRGFLAGLAIGGVVAAVMAKRAGDGLSAQGTLLQSSLRAGGDDMRTAYLAQGREIERQISAVGAAEAERIAQSYARSRVENLTKSYGFTPPRIQRLRALYERWF